MQRVLCDGVEIASHDGNEILDLPKLDKSCIFRIAVAIGRGERFPLRFGDFGGGFVHVLDEISLNVLLTELDTITDFATYLEKKEAFVEEGKRIITDGEENLLAVYLHQGRQFPSNYDVLQFDSSTWDEFAKKDEYQRKKEEDKQSYIWDHIIEKFSQDFRRGILLHDTDLGNLETALRILAKEDRFSRRVLSSSFLDFIGYHEKPKAKARIMKSPSNQVYVFLLSENRELNNEEREARQKELAMRCFVAKGLYQDVDTIVGIATEQYVKGGGYSYDLYSIYKKEWTEEDTRLMGELQSNFGYFLNPTSEKVDFNEYPKDE
ncbi:hypothetical protein ES705_35024 [subsurface metagenome]